MAESTAEQLKKKEKELADAKAANADPGVIKALEAEIRKLKKVKQTFLDECAG